MGSPKERGEVYAESVLEGASMPAHDALREAGALLDERGECSAKSAYESAITLDMELMRDMLAAAFAAGYAAAAEELDPHGVAAERRRAGRRR